MTRLLLRLSTGVLFFVASSLLIVFPVGMVLWVTIGDTHTEIWSASGHFVLALAVLLTGTFLFLDLTNRTSRRSVLVRFWISSAVCLFAFALKVHSEIERFRGWSSEAAAIRVAAELYPEFAGNFVLEEESRKTVPEVERALGIVFIVKSQDERLCRAGVARRYWWWTFWMSEMLKDRSNRLAAGDRN